MARLRASSVERRCDQLLDGFLLLLATWTVVYHVCLVLRLGTTWALGLEVVVLGASVMLFNRLAQRVEEPLPSPTAATAPPARARPLAAVTVVAAATAAVSTATSAPWALAWVP